MLEARVTLEAWEILGVGIAWVLLEVWMVEVLWAAMNVGRRCHWQPKRVLGTSWLWSSIACFNDSGATLACIDFPYKNLLMFSLTLSMVDLRLTKVWDIPNCQISSNMSFKHISFEGMGVDQQ